METPYLLFSNMVDFLLLNVLGVVISLYSLYIELKKEKDPSYRAYCDFNEHMSCSRVLTSRYSIGFGFMHVFFGKNHLLNARNCNLGLVLYVTNICMYLASLYLFYTSLFSVLGCVYLAFVLFIILKDLCLVCVSVYVVNGCLLYLSHAWRTCLKAQN